MKRGCSLPSTELVKTVDTLWPGSERTFHPVTPAGIFVFQRPRATTASSIFMSGLPVSATKS